jgi:hypothetical protein
MVNFMFVYATENKMKFQREGKPIGPIQLLTEVSDFLNLKNILQKLPH